MSGFFFIFLEAWQSINAYRLRSCLTMLGIIVGVCAVVLTLSFGEALRADIQRSIKSLGANMLNVMTNPNALTSIAGENPAIAYLTLSDADAIATLPDVVAVAPIKEEVAQVVAGAQSMNTSIVGTTPDILIVRELKINEGRMFSAQDAHSTSTVAVLGETVANKLFPSGGAVGSTVRINKLSMRVVGMLSKSGQNAGGEDQDNLVLVPIKTAQRQLFGSMMPDSIERISVSVQSPRYLSSVQQAITDLLHDRKQTSDEGEALFEVENLSSVVEAATQTAKTSALFLAITASISLIVGGIGIMNTMLVSVTERTREIGIRKALGASETIILLQFISEALMLSLCGCIIGIGMSFFLNHLTERLMTLHTHISLNSLLISAIASGLTGLMFGFFPALKASRLQPAEALRF